MKRSLLVLVLVCILGLVGCGNSEESTASVKNDVVEKQETNVESNEENEQGNIGETKEEKEIKETVQEERDNTTFRNTCWGDSREIVLNYETEELVDKNEKALMYDSSLLSYDVFVLYVFDNDKLFRSGYTVKNKYTSSGQYIVAYNDIKDSLIKIYGEPNDDGILALDDQDTIDYAGESDALNYGMIQYYSMWETDSSYINLGLSAENYEEKLIITYEDKNHEENLDDSGL